MHRHRRSIPLAALLAGLTLPAAAHAVTYCVGDPTCVSGGGLAQPGVQSALTAAAATPDADTVVVGAGIWLGNFSYTGASPLTLTGADRAATVLRPILSGPPAYPAALAVQPAAGASATV